MADRVDKETRSRIMSAVRSRGNFSTELRMIKILRKNHIKGWRRHYSLPGSPDFCWPKDKIALFVDGCFWHGCPRCKKVSKSNVTYWREKIITNRTRDKRVNKILKKKDWKVIRIWECQLRSNRSIRHIVGLLR